MFVCKYRAYCAALVCVCVLHMLRFQCSAFGYLTTTTRVCVCVCVALQIAEQCDAQCNPSQLGFVCLSVRVMVHRNTRAQLKCGSLILLNSSVSVVSVANGQTKMTTKTITASLTRSRTKRGFLVGYG